jgi:hypothetical protein
MVIVAFLANVIIMLALAFLLYKRVRVMKKFYWPTLAIKIFAGVMVGLLYSLYYEGGDTLAYFKDAQKLTALARDDYESFLRFLWSSETTPAFWQSLNMQEPRALFLTKTTSIFGLLTWDNYWLIASWFSFVSFACAWILVHQLVKYRGDLGPAAIFSLLLFPSVVFWTSGLIKESLAVAMLYFLISLFMRAWQQWKIPMTWWASIPLAFWLVWNLKYFYLAVLLPVIFTEFVYSYFLKNKVAHLHSLIRAGIWLLLFVAPLSMVTMVHPNFHPRHLLRVVVENHDAFISMSESNDVIRYGHLTPEVSSMIRNTPTAFFSAVFRPFLWEADNYVKVFAGVENLVILILALAALYSTVRGRKQLYHKGGNLILLYSFLLGIFLALSVPNFGTLSRYRTGFLPLFVLVLCYRNILFDGIVEKTNRLASRLVR